MTTPRTTAAPADASSRHGRWTGAVAGVFDADLRGVVRVLGGPGTGISSLLVDIATHRIAAGVDAESVLLLTGSGRVTTAMRSALTTSLLTAAGDAVVRQPLVRSVHAYAFGVLRLAAQRVGDPPPRLITSAEQDGVIRELLAGDLEDGGEAWPPHLHAALGTAGFATELRDLLARCTERGIDPLQLQRLGRSAGRPEWVAAGRFAQQYEQVMLLRSAVGTAAPQATAPALGAAELVGAALDTFATDPELLAAERARVRLLLVDDAQHLDPQAAQLVRLLAAGADLAVIAGDPNQAAFSFRGADPALLLAEDGTAVTLTASHRCAPAITQVITALGGQLPGAGPVRETTSAAPEGGVVTAQLAASEHAEANLVADALRRAHLLDDVPWSEMAVIVRSVPRAGAGLSRVLAAAGVPVAAPSTLPALVHNTTVRALLTVLTATVSGLTGEHALALLTGPLGRVDPVSLRQLRRALRRARRDAPDAEFGDMLVDILTHGIPATLAPGHSRPLKRIKTMLDATAATYAESGDPRSTLWQAWHRTGLQRRLVNAVERGGDAARRADADLDTVTALFDVAEQFASRTAGATVAGLVDHVSALQLPTPASEPVVAGGVEILSPQQALGREWDTVVIAGLQEGLWPNTMPRGGVLGTQRLLDVLAGVGDMVSDRAPLIADDRRLLITAVGRARRRLVVTAVDGEVGDDQGGVRVPSPFFYDIARVATGGDGGELPPPVLAPKVLSTTSVVGRLRAVACAPAGVVEDQARACAATQLARLAEAQVPGADPNGWHGMAEVSTGVPLWQLDGDQRHTVTLSPSTLQTLQDCPLRWLLERHGGRDARELRSALGSVVHALISEPGADEAHMLARLDQIWEQLPFESKWFARNEYERHRAIVQTFVRWRDDTRRELTEVGVEVDVDGVLDAPDSDSPDVRVRGRVDRVERDAEDRLVIVDVKTGKSPVTKDAAQQHAQLAAYQLAVAEGLVPDGSQPGGGRLVYIGKPCAAGATEREQNPMTEPGRGQWRAEVHRAASATAGPQFLARVNDGCTHCPVRPSCPAQNTRGDLR